MFKVCAQFIFDLFSYFLIAAPVAYSLSVGVIAMEFLCDSERSC